MQRIIMVDALLAQVVGVAGQITAGTVFKKLGGGVVVENGLEAMQSVPLKFRILVDSLRDQAEQHQVHFVVVVEKQLVAQAVDYVDHSIERVKFPQNRAAVRIARQKGPTQAVVFRALAGSVREAHFTQVLAVKLKAGAQPLQLQVAHPQRIAARDQLEAGRGDGGTVQRGLRVAWNIQATARGLFPVLGGGSVSGSLHSAGQHCVGGGREVLVEPVLKLHAGGGGAAAAVFLSGLEVRQVAATGAGRHIFLLPGIHGGGQREIGLPFPVQVASGRAVGFPIARIQISVRSGPGGQIKGPGLLTAGVEEGVLGPLQHDAVQVALVAVGRSDPGHPPQRVERIG